MTQLLETPMLQLCEECGHAPEIDPGLGLCHTCVNPAASCWPIDSNGDIPAAGIERLDAVVVDFATIVHNINGDIPTRRDAIDALTAGMRRTHLLGLAIALAGLINPTQLESR